VHGDHGANTPKDEEFLSGIHYLEISFSMLAMPPTEIGLFDSFVLQVCLLTADYFFVLFVIFGPTNSLKLKDKFKKNKYS